MRHAEATDLLLALRADVVGTEAPDWRRWANRLAGLTGREWLLLDQVARRSTWSQPALIHGTRGWLGPPVTEPTGVVAAASALHVDGRVRERAVEALTTRATRVATAALAVRLLDHVPEVRERARAGLAATGRTGDLDVVLDVLLAGSDRRHAPGALGWLVDEVLRDDARTLARVRGSGLRLARRWAFEESHARDLLDAEALVRTAAGDHDQWLRRSAADWLTEAPDPAQLARLLGADSVEARLAALTRTPDDLLESPTLERLLLDKAPRVRDQARWRARRRGIDVADLCRRHLSDTAVPAVVAALDGLAWHGDETDVGAVAALLDHPSPKVRAAAVRAAAARTGEADTIRLLAPCLVDPSPRVASAAATVLGRASAPPSIAEDAWASARPAHRRAAWRVTRSGGGWTRVEADLRAACDSDADLAGLGRDGVRSWLLVGAATTWGRPDRARSERMLDLLRGAGLGEQRTRAVAFHAGLSLPAVAPVVAPRPDRRRWRRRGWLRRRGQGAR